VCACVCVCVGACAGTWWLRLAPLLPQHTQGTCLTTPLGNTYLALHITHRRSKFISEFGSQSYPTFATYAEATNASDWQVDNPMTGFRNRRCVVRVCSGLPLTSACACPCACARLCACMPGLRLVWLAIAREECVCVRARVCVCVCVCARMLRTRQHAPRARARVGHTPTSHSSHYVTLRARFGNGLEVFEAQFKRHFRLPSSCECDARDT
jgi:hypothetical protein